VKLAGVVLLLCSLPALADPLPALRADMKAVTASGLSSGGYMAVQLHVAHSARVKGAGVIAAGPYYCAQGSLWTALYNCMTPGEWSPLPDTKLLKRETESLAKAERIDPTAHLAAARVWLFHGRRDRTVAGRGNVRHVGLLMATGRGRDGCGLRGRRS